MIRNIGERFDDIANAPLFKVVTTLLSAVGIFLFIFQVIELIKNKAYNTIILPALIISLLIAVSFWVLTKKEAIPPKGGEHFPGIGLDKLKETTTWQRPDEVSLIIKKIMDITNQGKITIITGDSGSGKSALTRLLLKEELTKRNIFTEIVYEYSDISNKLKNLFIHLGIAFLLRSPVEKPHGPDLDRVKGNYVFIFDQFENFLQNLLTHGEHSREEKIKEFCNICKNIIKYEMKVIIVIRKEFFINILVLRKFLENGYLPHTKDIIEIKGVQVKPSDCSIYAELRAVVLNEELANMIWHDISNKNNEVLPVEAQIIGTMIEDAEQKRGDGKCKDELNLDIYKGRIKIERENSGELNFVLDSELKNLYDRTLSKNVLINKYFQSFIEASPNKDITREVLFALSSRSLLRRAIDPTNIALYIHRSKYDVDRCLKFFYEEQLILKEDREYKWAHDYLAERYYEYSGSVMSPVARDNIAYFCSSTENNPRAEIQDILGYGKKNNWRKKLNYLGIILLSLLLLGRFFEPLNNYLNWSSFNLLATYQNKYQISHWPWSLIDIFYLPVLLSHAGWSYYITVHYHNFLSNLDENGINQLFSLSTVIICFFCVLFATFIPHAWLISIGVGGLWAGIRTYALSSTLRASEISESHFKVFGSKTIMNSVFLIFFGYCYYWIIKNAPHTFSISSQQAIGQLMNGGFYLSIIIALLMLYYLYFVKHHFLKSGTAILLGIYDRSKNVK